MFEEDLKKCCRPINHSISDLLTTIYNCIRQSDTLPSMTGDVSSNSSLLSLSPGEKVWRLFDSTPVMLTHCSMQSLVMSLASTLVTVTWGHSTITPELGDIMLSLKSAGSSPIS